MAKRGRPKKVRKYSSKGFKIVTLNCYKCGKPMKVADDVEKVLCGNCVLKRQIELFGIPAGSTPTVVKKSKSGKTIYSTTPKPQGWHFMKKFVDVDGSVYCKGKLVEKDSKETPTIKTEKFKLKPNKKAQQKTCSEQIQSGFELKKLKTLQIKLVKKVKKLNGGWGSKKLENDIRRINKKIKKLDK